MPKTFLNAAGVCALVFLLSGTAWSDAELHMDTANATVNCDGTFSLMVSGGGDPNAPMGTIYTVQHHDHAPIRSFVQHHGFV